MAYELVTAPTTEVITLEQAKLHLKVDTSADDDLITMLIMAARNRYEGPYGIYGSAFLTQTWDYFADSFPATGLEITFGPVQSVEEVGYSDSSGNTVVMDPSAYQVDKVSVPARIVIPGTVPVSSGLNSVKVRLKVGYGDTADKVPPLVVQVMLVAIGYWYANRGGYGSSNFPAWIDQLGLPAKRRWAM
jgi:uncharacterized phiE125 gp8 family phage protein